MFIIILLFSFFIQINASGVVIDVERFLENSSGRLRGESCNYVPSREPSKNLITVHCQISGRTDLVSVCSHVLTGGSGSLVQTFQVDDPLLFFTPNPL